MFNPLMSKEDVRFAEIGDQKRDAFTVISDLHIDFHVVCDPSTRIGRSIGVEHVNGLWEQLGRKTSSSNKVSMNTGSGATGV